MWINSKVRQAFDCSGEIVLDISLTRLNCFIRLTNFNSFNTIASARKCAKCVKTNICSFVFKSVRDCHICPSPVVHISGEIVAKSTGLVIASQWGKPRDISSPHRNSIFNTGISSWMITYGPDWRFKKHLSGWCVLRCNTLMHHLTQVIWEDTWKHTGVKSQTNAATVTIHSSGYIIWGHTWKHTMECNQTNYKLR